MILLKDVLQLNNNLSDYKLHIAKKAPSGVEPLDVYMNNFDDWKKWNESRPGKKNRFNRKYIISFIHFYPQPGTFLFGGVFEVLETYDDCYVVKKSEEFEDFIGRLKVTNIDTNRGSAFITEKYYDKIEVVELLDKPYSSLVFPGYERVNFMFKTIKNIISKQSSDWKGALENIKGIYMLTDTNNGKRYIGSAYGNNGVWARWGQYCANGHGGDVDLIKLVENQSYKYIEENFKFTLLEIHSMVTTDTEIILREGYWKEVMLSRDKKFGYNLN